MEGGRCGSASGVFTGSLDYEPNISMFDWEEMFWKTKGAQASAGSPPKAVKASDGCAAGSGSQLTDSQASEIPETAPGITVTDETGMDHPQVFEKDKCWSNSQPRRPLIDQRTGGNQLT